ncbi:MAG: glycosyl transferase [Cellvibrionales bacterium]|nr:glycosyl transferase [Cellvibrionales bacterium]
MKQIICINWGTRYGPPYINRLYASVVRNITPPFRFVCFCDNSAGIRAEVDCQPLPGLPFILPETKSGIWRKSQLWNAQLADLQGPVLFLDLDVVITANIDPFFTRGQPDDVILARSPTNPFERLGQTSVYRFPVGKLKPLLDEFAQNPAQIAAQYRFEQRYVTRKAPGGVKLWPASWVAHFRRHCRRPFPLNYFYPPKLRRKSKIVIFAGALNPTDAIAGIYDHRRPIHRTPRQHIVAGFKGGGGQENIIHHLRHYILPTPWVAEHWRE